MLTIRLQRVGKKKLATYRLVISEKARDPHDIYLENLGTFNPHAKENAFLPKAERIKYWLGKGAGTSGTVHNLLVTAGIIQGKKQKAVFLSEKRKKKLAEKKSATAKGGQASGSASDGKTEPASAPAAS